jgi:hypothetical protein
MMGAQPGAMRGRVPDGWDRLALALVPFGAVMLACVSTSVEALAKYQPDVVLYFKDAGLLLAGQLPYSGFHFEYPPLALVPMAIPYLAWPGGAPTLLDYEWLWAVQNAVLAMLVGLMVGWLASRPGSGGWSWRALALWALIAVIEAPVLAWRFDITAVALAMLGVVLLVADRPLLAGGSLALGALVKIFPAALLPVGLAWFLVRREWSAAVRLLAGFAVVGGLLLGAVVLAVGTGPVGEFISYQQDRLVQLESVMSSALLLLHVLTGAGVAIDYDYQSLQIVGAGTDQFLAIENPLMVLAILGVGLLAWLRFRSEWRAGRSVALSTLFAYLAAAVLAVLVTNKVFSAQYLLWVLPLGLLLPRRAASALVIVAILSIVIYPLSYKELFELQVPAILTLVARNALLLGLLAWALYRFRPLRAPAVAETLPAAGGGPGAEGSRMTPTPSDPARPAPHPGPIGEPLSPRRVGAPVPSDEV